MDLKGSLHETTLKIYPSEKLIAFVNKLSFQEGIPWNISKFRNAKKDKIIETDDKQINKLSIEIDSKDILMLKEIKQCLDTNSTFVENQKSSNEEEIKPTKKKITLEDTEQTYLTISDLKWLLIYLQKQRNTDQNIPYLHELLEGAHIEMPENRVLKRNPDLEARCVKLRAQQEAREYRKMTRSVDNVRIRFPEDTIAYQLKHLNRQLIAIGQFIISIFAGFLFGFRGIELMIGNLDFGFRLLLGVMCALIIALAEIYFLAKKLNEELSVIETVQLGGPPKFANEPNVTSNGAIIKEHQD